MTSPRQATETLAQVFPILSRALLSPQEKLPLATAFRLRQWPSIAQTLALAGCRQRDHVIGELTAFPTPWYDMDVAGDWGQPLRAMLPSRRLIRGFHRAGIVRWREVVERTPPEVLDLSGAGLLVLSEALVVAIELAAVFMTDPLLRHGTRSSLAFGSSGCDGRAGPECARHPQTAAALLVEG